MGECIAATEEVVEEVPGEALRCRTAAFGHYHGLGPPDLCVLEKESNSWLSHDAFSAYHWVVGVEPANAAAACSYFRCLLRHQEKASWLAPKYTLKRGTLCCWNPFSRVDSRVEMEVPGSVHEYAVQEDGATMAMTPQLWEETFLASVLRSMDRLPSVSPLKVLRPVLTIQGERDALRICYQRFEAGVLLGCGTGRPSASGSRAALANNRMVDVLKHFFGGSSRFGDFAEFLAPRAAQDGEVLVWLIEMEVAKKNWAVAWERLLPALCQQPDCAALLRCHAQLLALSPLPDPDFALRPDTLADPSPRRRVALAPGPQNLTSKQVSHGKVALRRPSSVVSLPPPEVHHVSDLEPNGVPLSPVARQHSANTEEARQRRAAQCRLQLERAVALGPEDPQSHLLLATALLEAGHYADALRRLNAIPVPSLLGSSGPAVPEEDQELVVLFGVSPVVSAGIPVPGPDSRRTAPERRPDPMWGEDGSDDEYDDEEEEEEFDEALKNLEGHGLRGVALVAYQLLVRAHAALGWEALLALRSETFQMEGEPQVTPNKVMAARWFDALFHVLHADLRQMNRWKVEDEEAQFLHEEDDGAASTSGETVFDVHDRSATDWYYRGKLARRLLKVRSAVQAFRMSCFKRVTAPACFRLLEVYAQHGALQEAVLVVGPLLGLLCPTPTEDEGDHSAGCPSTDKDILHPPVHPIVRRALFTLVAQHGLCAVRAHCTALPAPAHRRLAEVLTDAVQLRVHGYDS